MIPPNSSEFVPNSNSCEFETATLWATCVSHNIKHSKPPVAIPDPKRGVAVGMTWRLKPFGPLLRDNILPIQMALVRGSGPGAICLSKHIHHVSMSCIIEMWDTQEFCLAWGEQERRMYTRTGMVWGCTK